MSNTNDDVNFYTNKPLNRFVLISYEKSKSSVNVLQLLSDVLVRGYGMNKMKPLRIRKHTKS